MLTLYNPYTETILKYFDSHPVTRLLDLKIHSELRHAINNIFVRHFECLQAEGKHFHHVL
jgi:hypothetical protein